MFDQDPPQEQGWSMGGEDALDDTALHKAETYDELVFRKNDKNQ